MLKNLFFIIFSCVLGLCASAQQKFIHDDHVQSRQVGHFHAIKVSTGIHLYLTEGAGEAVAVSAADSSLRSRIRTEVENGVLKIYFDYKYWGSWRAASNKKLKAYVSFASLDALTANAGALVEVDGTVRSQDLSLHFSSGAVFSGKVQVTSLEVNQSSGAQATISGAAASMKADASSGGMMNGSDLEVGLCEARASSGGGMNIHVLKELSASANSGGYVNYQGAGVIRQIHTSSGGSVSRQ